MIISTNMDGLHRRSGVTSDNIVELHGNSYRELCDSCDKEYIRDFNVGETVKNRRDHKTGRFCECGGNLRDSIIHFCENMREKDMKIATENARKADLAIVMGTSMNVHPAASLCDKVLKNPNGAMVIINLQKTPYDHEAAVKISVKTDEFMKLLLKELSLSDLLENYINNNINEV